MGKRLNQSTKDAIRRIWKGGAYDTMQLADRFRLTEPQIYSVIANRNAKPKAQPLPQSDKVPYAGKATSLPTVRQTAFVKPIPRYAGYDPTERL